MSEGAHLLSLDGSSRGGALDDEGRTEGYLMTDHVLAKAKGYDEPMGKLTEGSKIMRELKKHTTSADSTGVISDLIEEVGSLFISPMTHVYITINCLFQCATMY